MTKKKTNRAAGRILYNLVTRFLNNWAGRCAAEARGTLAPGKKAKALYLVYFFLPQQSSQGSSSSGSVCLRVLFDLFCARRAATPRMPQGFPLLGKSPPPPPFFFFLHFHFDACYCIHCTPYIRNDVCSVRRTRREYGATRGYYCMECMCTFTPYSILITMYSIVVRAYCVRARVFPVSLSLSLHARLY